MGCGESPPTWEGLKLRLNITEDKRIINTLVDVIGMERHDAIDFVERLKRTGKLQAFGAGSLLVYSHLQNDDKSFKPGLSQKFPNIDTDSLFTVTPAKLRDFRRDFVCQDIFYRGTKEKPGVTIGLERDENSFTSGGILETDLTNIGLRRDQYADFIVYYLEQFKDREFPPNMPIYTFSPEKVVLENDETRVALSCVADVDGPLYAGNLSVEERAYILATAMGPTHNPTTGAQKPIGAVTDLDYLRATINASIEKNIPVEDHIIDLYELAVAMRQELNAKARFNLASFEAENAHATPDLKFISQKGTPVQWNLAPGKSSVLGLDGPTVALG